MKEGGREREGGVEGENYLEHISKATSDNVIKAVISSGSVENRDQSVWMLWHQI